MARFAAWAKSKAPESESAEGYVGAAATEAKPDVKSFLVDNGVLKSKSRGIRFRGSPDYEDKLRRDLKVAEFGTVIKATPHSGEWVKVRHNQYLPRHFGGVPVLIEAWWLNDGSHGQDQEDLDAQQPGREENDVLGNLMARYDTATCPEKKLAQDEAAATRERARIEEVKMARKLEDMEAFQTADLQPGTGTLYTVIRDKAIIRASPSVDAKMRNFKGKGDTVELFDWDDARKWRRVYDADIRITGWMLLDHPELGPLLRPVGYEDCEETLSPVCAAVIENDIDNLRQFITEGMVVNTVGRAGFSPLALAAKQGHLECCVLLLQASAKVNLDAIVEGQAKVLLRALSGQTVGLDTTELNQVVESLSPDAQVIADRLLEQATTVRETLENTAAEATSPPPRSASPATPGSALAAESPFPAGEDLSGDAEPGVDYEVIHDAVWIRSEPKPSGAQLGMRRRGQIVTMFGFDETGTWRRVRTGGAQNQQAKELFEPEGLGWMLIAHPKLGALLKPVYHDEA